MRIIKTKSYEEMSKKAANIIASVVTLKPDCMLGLATGSSPIGTYDELVKKYEAGDLDFSEVTTVNLDEYKGLPKENEQSYYYFMHEYLFDKVNINPEKTYLPDGTNLNSEEEAARYEALVQSLGTVDLQLLGLGRNGHIGFNEPGDHFEDGTHCVDLKESTIEANKRFFESADDVPKQAYSMGIGTIMRSKKILLVVSGEEKAQALKDSIYGPVTPEVPGSILRFHPDVTIIADEAAIGMVNQKTTAVRVIPVVGKGIGETVEFGGLLGYAPIMPVNKFDCSAFVNRVGRIPAPIHSFKN